MQIEAGKHYWYFHRQKAHRVTGITILEIKRGTRKENVYVVLSSVTVHSGLHTAPMKVVGNGQERPYAGPNRHPLFDTERGAVQHEAKQLRDEATQMMDSLDDQEELDVEQDSIEQPKTA